MKLKDLAELVKQMREAQTLYFQDRSPRRLSIAKELERRVDKACSNVLDQQRKLF